MIRVLLVDDHPSLRAGVRRSLDAHSEITVVAEAGDGKDALRKARDLAPDVVVLDVDLPVLSGAEVAQALRDSPCRVLGFSAHASRGLIRAMLDAGAAGYVTKDQPEEELVAAVLAVARGEGRWLVDVRDLSDPLAGLTARERDVLTLLARGRSNAVIAETLFVSLSTVRNTLTLIYDKLSVRSGREAVAWAWEHGLGPRR